MNDNKIRQDGEYLNLTHIMLNNIKPFTKLKVVTLNCSNSLIGLRSVEDENAFIYVTLDVLDRCFYKVEE